MVANQYRILVTGTRNELNTEQNSKVSEAITEAVVDIDLDAELVIVHGACPTGVDALASWLVGQFINARAESHPADWNTHGRAAGPIRNREMVNLGADICLAFPLGASRGTRGCIALAQAAGIPTTVIELED